MTKIEELESLLIGLDSARSALPNLLHSFSASSTTSPSSVSPNQLADLYAARSKKAREALLHLSEGLQESEGIMRCAAESEARDGTGIIIKKRIKQEGLSNDLSNVLGSSEAKKPTKELRPIHIRTSEELEEVLNRWSTSTTRLQWQMIGKGGNKIVLVLTGIMKSYLFLHQSVETSSIQVERVACYGIDEEVSDSISHLR